MADSTPTPPPTHSPADCAACRIAGILSSHRDSTATDWSLRRGTLNFAILIAQRECPAHQAAWVDGTAV